jgi:Na+-translocating ferredoxin:NAD+ oxidoreductase RnfC subunit
MNLLEKIAAAGIVGCGGAGFPTHVKLKGTFEYLIVNGAECEPLLRNDRYLMRNKAPELVEAVSAIAAELKIPHAVIALKAHYEDEIAALRKAVRSSGAKIEIHELESFYPAGDEQTIVYEVTGRVVPPAGLPSAVGAVVDNVATIYAVYEAMHDIPFTQKYLTVTGEVKKPVILKVPVGTSFRRCIELAGGALLDDFFVVSGGPMMGRPVPMDALDGAFVTKTTSGILVLPPDSYHATQNAVSIPHMLNRARSACIQCTSCTQLCPRHMLGHPLQPHRIMRKLALGVDIKSMLDDPDIRNAQLCCECGICEVYACPMGLQPRKVNALVKSALAEAKIRYQRTEDHWTPNPEREERKAPTDKVAARVGVRKYNNYVITDLVCDEPAQVTIPMKMNVGAPAVPVVSIGDHVIAGSVIARPPEGALGAVIHASIDGCVKSVGDKIVLVKE